LRPPLGNWPETDLHIGISGWTYPPWRGVFYPKKLPHRLELSFASRAFNSIEINGCPLSAGKTRTNSMAISS